MDDKIRIDIYLASKYNLSRTKVSQAIKNGSVLVDGEKILSPGFCIDLTKDVSIVFNRDGINDCQKIATTITPTQMDLNIVYEDQYLMVVNKPSGILTHPTHYGETSTLANAIAYHLQSALSTRSGILHRLDRNTSGLVLVAKDLDTLQKLQEQLMNHKIDRIYLAIVQGNFAETQGSIDAMIGYCGHQKMKMKVNGVNSKDAFTKFFVLSQSQQLSLVACQLLSGRTHQIRVHLSYIDHPVLNDPLYGRSFDQNYGQFLHAFMLRFSHPWTKKRLEFTTEPDQIFLKKIHEAKLVFDPNSLYEKI